MKAFLMILIILLTGSAASAQVSPDGDSLRVVVLQEVLISAKQRSQQQQLYAFFNPGNLSITEDILARLPELSLIRRGSYGMEPVIRSFNSSQVNLLVDGMRIHGACTDKMDPASIYIEPVNLNSIEVRTTGNSLMNGASVGGSVNLQLAEATLNDDPHFSGTATSGFQSAAHAFFQSLSVDYGQSGWGLRASGTYRRAHNYRDGKGNVVPFSQHEKINYSLNGKILLNSSSVLKIDLLADDGWNIGYPALPMDVGFAAARIAAVSIVKEPLSGPWNRIEAKGYANHIRHYMDDTQRPDVAVHMDMPGKSTTTGFYAEGSRQHKRGSLKLRADGSLTALSASMTMYQPGQSPMFMLTWPDNRQLQSGLASEYQIALDSATQLSIHARADYSSFELSSQLGKDQLAVFNDDPGQRRYFIPALSVMVSRKLAPRLRGSLSLGLNGRTPTASELYGFYLFNAFDGFDYIGNTGLKQEMGQQTELSVSYQHPSFKAQLTGYVSRVKNYILGSYTPQYSAMTIGARGVKQYINQDYALLAGMEASLVCKPLPDMQLVSTLKYAYGRDEHGEPLPMITPLRNISSIRYTVKRLWLQGEMEIAAAQYRVSTTAKERTTGSFTICHFRAGYPFILNNLKGQLNAGVENLFDVYYREHLDWGHVARPGRNVTVQLMIRF